MARYLPAHQDRYFVALNNAFAGTYKLRFDEEAPDSNSDAVEAAVERRLADMHRRAEPQLRKLRPKKRGR